MVLYEFLFGFPPFNAETPEKVFDNILSGRIDWHNSDQLQTSEDEEGTFISAEARDLIRKLLCQDPKDRLGSGGADEVKAHPFFSDIDWDTILSKDAAFIPQCEDPESTAYFDARGATLDEDTGSKRSSFEEPALSSDIQALKDESQDAERSNDFGTFNFKNLQVLKQANDDVIKRLRTEQLIPSPEKPGYHAPVSRRASIAGKPVIPRSGSLNMDSQVRHIRSTCCDLHSDFVQRPSHRIRHLHLLEQSPGATLCPISINIGERIGRP